MRRVLFIGIVSLFAVSGALGQLPATPLEGTWEMVSQQAVYPDSTVDRTDQIPYTIKDPQLHALRLRKADTGRGSLRRWGHLLVRWGHIHRAHYLAQFCGSGGTVHRL